MQAAMQVVGFVGVEATGGVIYARTYSAVPEFTVTPEGLQWRFAIEWPLRASEAQRRHQACDTCANHVACSLAAHARPAVACGMGMIPMA
jgi:hypothetical protein